MGLVKLPPTTPAEIRRKGFVNGRQFTVIRGVAYDVTDFIKQHPGGEALLSQAVGRDATGLYESYHLRNEIADRRLASLPKLPSVPETVELDPGPFPNDSEFYLTVKKRVRDEILKGGQQRGGLFWHNLCSVLIWTSAYLYYMTSNSYLSGLCLGAASAHIGMTLNHCGNHGGLTHNPLYNYIFGFANDLIGGSSLVWCYQHHVSHHIYTNSVHRDQDVFSAFPFIRFDERLPGKWFHRFQHLYIPFLFPFLFLQKHVSDFKNFRRGRTVAVEMIGATEFDYFLGYVAKAIHFFLVLVWPLLRFGAPAFSTYLVFAVSGSVILAWLFAVSHNLDEAKCKPSDEHDWAIMQVCHSANYGGYYAGLATGGLNLQIEHHLFPALAYKHYPAAARIVREECRKRNIRYTSYDALPEMLLHFLRFMKHVGEAH